MDAVADGDQTGLVLLFGHSANPRVDRNNPPDRL
jgi:hypothetical protein